MMILGNINKITKVLVFKREYAYECFISLIQTIYITIISVYFMRQL